MNSLRLRPLSGLNQAYYRLPEIGRSPQHFLTMFLEPSTAGVRGGKHTLALHQARLFDPRSGTGEPYDGAGLSLNPRSRGAFDPPARAAVESPVQRRLTELPAQLSCSAAMVMPSPIALLELVHRPQSSVVPVVSSFEFASPQLLFGSTAPLINIPIYPSERSQFVAEVICSSIVHNHRVCLRKII